MQVLHNSLSGSNEELHLLTYKLCHTYFNIPTATRQPAPVLYARKLARQAAERSVEKVEDQPSKLVGFKTHQSFTSKAPGLYFL